MADAALQAFLGAVWADVTDFVFDEPRFEAAYHELEDAAYAGSALSVVITPVEGLVIESDEVPLGEGLSLVRAITLTDAPQRPARRPARRLSPCSALESTGRPRAGVRRSPPEAPADRPAPVGRRRALARPDRLRAHRRQRRG